MTGHKLKDATANVLTRHIQHTAYSRRHVAASSTTTVSSAQSVAKSCHPEDRIDAP